MATKMGSAQDMVLPYTIRSIYLRDCTMRMDDGFDPLVPGQRLSAIFRTGQSRVSCRETVLQEGNTQATVRSCAFTTRFDFAYTKATEDNATPSDEDIEKAIAAQITADITVDYLINTASFPDQEDLAQWAGSNVLLHAWPYWRELCHSTMLRMNLPVTMIPLVQFSAPPGAAEQSASESNRATTKRTASKSKRK